MKPVTRFILIISFAALVYFLMFRDKGKEENSILNTDQAKENLTWYEQITPEEVQLVDSGQTNYYIIFDASGSMRGQKIADATKALKKFLSIIPAKANVGMLAFSQDGIDELASLGSERKVLINKIDDITAGGTTPLGKSMELAYKKLALQAKKQRGYGDYNLIVITDGEATDELHLNNAVDIILARSPIIIHTIGFHIYSGHSLNQPGKIYYKTAKNLEELSKGLEAVLAELDTFTIDTFYEEQ